MTDTVRKVMEKHIGQMFVDLADEFNDNWGSIVGMFDSPNQQKLLAKLSPEAREKVQRWI